MKWVRLVGAVTATAALVGAAAVLARSTPQSIAAVSLGDSFISGEGGGRYGASADSGCDRSAMAPIRSAPIAVDRRVNLACSGAREENIWRAVAGGKSHRGEPPQADQLATVARRFDVDLVVLTVGANDLGFGALVADCALDWARSSEDDPRYCHGDAQAEINSKLPAASRGLRKGIREIRAAMTSAGESRDGYRLFVMGYASPFPLGMRIRYPESGWSRLTKGGCPLWNADADWVGRWALPTIATMMRGAARVEGAEYLDLQHVLEGHEICSRGVRRPLAPGIPSQAAEWFRRLSFTDGPIRESLHPNPIGQRVIGRCLARAYATSAGNHFCTS
jgi:lysophospholipase L1-like esterase